MAWCDDATDVRNWLAKEEIHSHHRHFCTYHLNWFEEGAEGKWSSS